jgi:hypothetical protein
MTSRYFGDGSRSRGVEGLRLGTEGVLELVVGLVDESGVSVVFGDVAKDFAASLDDLVHAGNKFVGVIVDDATSEELIEVVLDLTLLVAGKVTNSSCDELGVMRASCFSEGSSSSRVKRLRLGTELVLQVVGCTVDSSRVEVIFGDVADSLACCLDDPVHARSEFVVIIVEGTSEELFQSILELALLVAMTEGCSNDFGIVRTRRFGESSSSRRVKRLWLGTELVLEVVGSTVDSSRVGMVFRNVAEYLSTSLDDLVHASVKTILKLTLLVAGKVTNSSRDELRVVRTSCFRKGSSGSRVERLGLGAKLVLKVVGSTIDSSRMEVIFGDVADSLACCLDDPIHTSDELILIVSEVTSEELCDSLLKLALLVSGEVTDGSSDELGVMRTGCLSKSSSSSRVKRLGLGAELVLEVIGGTIDGGRVGMVFRDVAEDLPTSLDDPVHTSDKRLGLHGGSGVGRTCESDDGDGSSNLSLSSNHYEYKCDLKENATKRKCKEEKKRVKMKCV